MATVARTIWLHRNIVVFGGKLAHPSQLIRDVKEAMEEFKIATQNVHTNVEQDRNTEVLE